MAQITILDIRLGETWQATTGETQTMTDSRGYTLQVTPSETWEIGDRRLARSFYRQPRTHGEDFHRTLERIA